MVNSMFNLSSKKIFAIPVLLLILVVVLSIFQNHSNSPLSAFESPKNVDNVVLSDLPGQAFETEKTEKKETNLKIKTNSNKNLGLLADKTKNLLLGSSKDDQGNYFFDNLVGFSRKLNLGKLNDPEQSLQAIYDANAKQLNFVLPKVSFGLNNKKIESGNKALYILKNVNPSSILDLNDKVVDLGKYGNDNYVSESDLVNKKILVSSTITQNLFDPMISNFTSGLWAREVGDCSNKVEGSPQISMYLGRFLRNNYLVLSSKNHLACSSKTFPIKLGKNKIYKLSFDYKALKGNKIRYYYQLSGGVKESVSFSENISSPNTNWNTFSTFIRPTDDFENINIHFYAPSDGTEEITNAYDNVKLEEVKFESETKLEKQSAKENSIELAKDVVLQNGVNKIEPNSDSKNLLDGSNPSFEDGFWKDKVGDCCSGSAEEAKISMDKSDVASDGKQALKLSSSNHCACTNKTFPITMTENGTYRLSFDYKNLKGGKAQYYYALHNGVEKDETKNEVITAPNNDWNHFETIINSNLNNINSINIHFYASSDGKEEVTNLYDNVKLTEWLPKDIDSYYLHATQNVDESPKLKDLEYKAVDRWRNEVVLHGVKSGFLLIYPEEYSEKWQAYPVQSEASEADMSVPEGYAVPDVESNRQATKEELLGFINDKLISHFGSGFVSKNFDGAIRNDNLPNPSFLATWFKKPIAEDIHYKVNDYSNSWWIDPAEICNLQGESQKGKGESLCTKNEDGTWNITLVVEKKTGKTMGILLLILWMLLIGSLAYIIYGWKGRSNFQSIFHR